MTENLRARWEPVNFFDGKPTQALPSPRFSQNFVEVQWHKLQPVWFWFAIGAEKNAQTEVSATRGDPALRPNPHVNAKCQNLALSCPRAMPHKVHVVGQRLTAH